MKITDLNPHGGIGSNCTLFETGPFRFVIDSGLHPKFAGHESLPKHDLIERNTLDFIILTHCHLDHLGSLPLLSRTHPDAPILLSYPSSIIARRMLANSVSVMRRQRNELNLPELPLYGRGDLSSLYDRMKTLSINRPQIIEKDGKSAFVFVPNLNMPAKFNFLCFNADLFWTILIVSQVQLPTGNGTA